MTPGGWTAAALLLSLAACVPAPVPSTGSTRSTAASTPVDDPRLTGEAAIQHLATLVNRHRVSAGCPALQWMPEAGRVAQAHSNDMARRNYFNHVTPEGGTPMDRLRAAGILWQRMAENIAQTSGGPDDALRLWLNSPGHRQNLDECAYTHHGIGERGGRWTHVFVTPQGAP